jgi:hypothetical protein
MAPGHFVGVAVYGPLFLLLVLRNWPDGGAVGRTLELLFGTGMALSYVRLPASKWWLRTGLSWIMSGALFLPGGLLAVHDFRPSERLV